MSVQPTTTDESTRDLGILSIMPAGENQPLERDRRAALGQFLTPEPVAELMAGFLKTNREHVRLIDPGAGAGALTTAFVRRICQTRIKPKTISVTAYELDPVVIASLRPALEQSRRTCEDAGIAFSSEVFDRDFVEAAVSMLRPDLFAPPLQHFNAAILNPPYCKIRSLSQTRLLLRSVGIETSNLYTGFVALAIKLLEPDGELVAITPRSFCNGPYFKPFRQHLLLEMSLRRLHVFDSRSAAFRGDEVLQENVILHAVRGVPPPDRVIISNSPGHADGAVTTREVDYDDVVSPADPEQFIHLALDEKQAEAKVRMARLSTTLNELDLTVSTGRVVDFRHKEHLRREPGEDTVPLIYPRHFAAGFVQWPREVSRKPNAIVDNEQTRGLLVPAGAYVLIKRFTSKEERRRLVACVYDPDRVRAPLVAFENHLNYFHAQGRGLSMNLAMGLAAFLNSTFVDVYFRQFSGHTQVNATDLRSMKYPTTAQLDELGELLDGAGAPPPDLDELVGEALS